MFAAFTLGLRHGVDWDHIAAITDLTGSQARPRRSMLLATLYVLGHAAMVLALGTVAILFGNQIPDSLDAAMGYVVGVTLVMLGVYVLWTLAVHRGDAPIGSRWMLAIGALRRGIGRVRHREDVVIIEHVHEHSHDGLHDHAHDEAALRAQMERNAAEHRHAVTATRHGHLHRHVMTMPDDPFVAAGPWTAAGVGMLHGIGAETPTQILIFAAAADASGRGASLAILVSFLVGLVCSNTLIALGSTFGFLGARGNRAVLVTLSLVTAVVSLGLGTLLLTGKSDVLPPLLGG